MNQNAEREYLLRTVLGEASNQGPDGMAAVAHVILNRKNSGRWGNDIRSVVTAKSQFEPWGSPEGRKRMMGYKPGSTAYDTASQVVDGVLSGQITDPTGGADHFLNEAVVRERRGGSLPKWANNMSATAQRLGDHTFYGGSGSAAMRGAEAQDQPKPQTRSKYFDSKLGQPAAPAAAGGEGRSAYFDSFMQKAPASAQNANVPEGMVLMTRDDGSQFYYDTKAEAAREAKEGGMADHVTGLLGSAVKGVPFVGEYVDEAIGAIDETFGGTPGLQRERARASQAQFETDHPYQALGSQVATGIATAAPAIGPLARLASTGTAQNVLKAGAAGMALGGADGVVSGYGSGTDAESRRQEALRRGVMGAGVGAVAGAAAPVIGKGAEIVTRNVMDRIGPNAARTVGASPEATEIVARTLQNDNPQQAVARIAEAGDQAMLADAGPSAAGLLDTAIQRAGPGGRVAREAIGERASQAGADVEGALDQFLGKPRGLKEEGSAIAQRSAEVRRIAYNRAYQTPVDYAAGAGRKVEEVLSRIPPRVMSKAIQAANEAMIAGGRRNQQIMAEISDDGVVAFREMPNVEQLDAVKRALGEMGSEVDLLGRTTAEARIPKQLARELRGAIGEAVPPYNRAVQLGGEKIAEDNALLIGNRLLSRTVTREDVADVMKGATAAETRAARVGLRRSLDEIMGNVKRALTDTDMDAREGVAALKALSSRDAREKVRLILGDEVAGKMFARIDRASKAFELKARTNDNSKTFARMSMDEQIKAMTEPGAIQTLMQGAPAGAAKRLVQRMTAMTPEARAQVQERISGEIATILTQSRGPQAERAVRAFTTLLERQPATQALAARIGSLTATGAAAGAYSLGTELNE